MSTKMNAAQITAHIASQRALLDEMERSMKQLNVKDAPTTSSAKSATSTATTTKVPTAATGDLKGKAYLLKMAEDLGVKTSPRSTMDSLRVDVAAALDKSMTKDKLYAVIKATGKTGVSSYTKDKLIACILDNNIPM